MKTVKRISVITVVCMILILMTASVQGADVKLPSTLAWTAYNVGSSGYNHAVAIGKTLKDAYNVTLRVVPGKNDISRLALVKTGRIQFSASGSGVFYAVEGVLDFANPEWGPQPIRMVMSCTGSAGLAMGTAKDANIKTPYDLKGKRIAFVRGAPALQTNVTAFMAFGNVGWKDVKRVEVSGFAGAWRALINGQVDAMSAFTIGGSVTQAAASSRGLHWLALPFDDNAGWARLQKVAPHMTKRSATLGVAGVSKKTPLPCAGFPYPILITYQERDSGLVYNMAKAVSTQQPNFAKAEPSAMGWADKRQNFKWVVPFHEGAVKFWKEKGLWTDDFQKHNDALLKRQKILADAWAGMKDKSGEDFKSRWAKVRAEALSKQGLEPIWTK